MLILFFLGGFIACVFAMCMYQQDKKLYAPTGAPAEPTAEDLMTSAARGTGVRTGRLVEHWTLHGTHEGWPVVLCHLDDGRCVRTAGKITQLCDTHGIVQSTIKITDRNAYLRACIDSEGI